MTGALDTAPPPRRAAPFANFLRGQRESSSGLVDAAAGSAPLGGAKALAPPVNGKGADWDGDEVTAEMIWNEDIADALGYGKQ